MKRKLMIAAASLTFMLGMGTTAYAQPELMPDGTLFDAEYYAQANPDVVAALGADAGVLYQHYVAHGKAEGRAAISPLDVVAYNEEFDAEHYAKANPDVAAALGTNPIVLYNHYIKYGKAEGRLGKAPSTQTVSDNYEKQVLNIANKERGAAGVAALSWSDELANAAAIRAAEISDVFSHTRPNGSDCFSVLSECGISYRRAGENIAWGQRSAEEVMNDWMHSAGHRANILNKGYGKLGVGYYADEYGDGCWVQLFTN